MIQSNWFRLSGIVVYAGWETSMELTVGKLRLIVAPDDDDDDSRFANSVLVAGLMDLSSIKVNFGDEESDDLDDLQNFGDVTVQNFESLLDKNVEVTGHIEFVTDRPTTLEVVFVAHTITIN
jgi:hypothetical protein